jgi:hypothetical protein
MQQNFQQNWGNPSSSSSSSVPLVADNFAAMSAMIQHMLPAGVNNYMPTPYHQPYQNQQQQQQVVGGPDVSSIPLPPPPPSEIPLPPQEIPILTTDQYQIPNSLSSPPTGSNPYLTGYNNPYDSSASTPSRDSNEYVPPPYYKSVQDGMMNTSYNSEFTAGYHPSSYQQQQQHTPSQVSPDYSNHSSNSNSNAFDPMALFASALSKNKQNNSSSSSACSPTSSQDSSNLFGATTPTTENNIFNPADSFYTPNPFEGQNMFSKFSGQSHIVHGFMYIFLFVYRSQ